MKNRQWLLDHRPTGAITRDEFRQETAEVEVADLTDGQILVQHQVYLMAPALRGWMSEDRSPKVPAIDPGDVIFALCGSKVVASKNKDFPEGARIFCIGSWREFQILDPDAAACRLIADDLSLVRAMGACGPNALTAYFGLTRVGDPKEGETLLVSGAAGSTGSTVVQLGKILGLKVIGIAGGPDKCRWLTEDFGADGAIDYKTENVADRIATLCPEGVDVFYDNVGGDILQAAVDHMNTGGRIVLCGQMTGYDKDAPAPGPRDMMQLVYGSMRMQGFMLFDYLADWDEGQSALKNWVTDGRLKPREDIRRGFDGLPAAFADLFRGANDGTLLVVTDDDALTAPTS